MTIIKAPFNFVPVSDTVFTPDWADQISQDIPFEDGMSGTIELKITAETPIFIKTGQRRDQKDEDNSFSNVNGEYFIPGTSLKGSIRNVLEIMSFGKMDHVENKKFTFREGKNKKLYSNSIYETMPKKHLNNEIDLADCLFGYLKEKNSLKGRIQFSHLFSENVKHEKEITLILGSPKASYYPIYIRQEGNKKLKTYNDDGTTIAGWKRYMVRKEIWEDKTNNKKLDTNLKPIKKDTEFKGKIRFHNL